MSPILTIKLEKIQRKTKTDESAQTGNQRFAGKMRKKHNSNEYIESEATLTDDHPEKKVVEKSGCAKHHYNLKQCVATYGDWIKCQDLVKTFKDCMIKERKRRGGTYSDFYVDMGTAARGSL